MPAPVAELDRIAQQLRNSLPALIWSLVIVIFTFISSRLASGRMRTGLERGGFHVNVAILLSRALWIALWILGFLLVLYQFGIGVTPLAAAVGIAGLAASLSLQTVLQNLVAGVYLLAERPFHIGDVITINAPSGVNEEGRVEDIQLRTTHLRNRDDELVLVPNSAVFSGVITNRTAVGGFVRRVTVTFPRDSELEAATTKMLALLDQLPSVLGTPRPRLRVEQVGKDDWTACLSIWAKSSEDGSAVVWAIARAFPEATVNVAGTPT